MSISVNIYLKILFIPAQEVRIILRLNEDILPVVTPIIDVVEKPGSMIPTPPTLT
jgi:hypothetical protein